MTLAERIKNGEFKTKLPFESTPRADYRADVHRLERVEFKKALLEELGVINHPKADKLWDLAWEYGHSSGLDQVLLHAEEFVELIK